MKGLQQFERDHREKSLARKGGAEDQNGDDGDDAFRKMAMSFYRDDRPVNRSGAAKARVVDQPRRFAPLLTRGLGRSNKTLSKLSEMQRKRAKGNGSLDVVTNHTM